MYSETSVLGHGIETSELGQCNKTYVLGKCNETSELVQGIWMSVLGQCNKTSVLGQCREISTRECVLKCVLFHHLTLGFLRWEKKAKFSVSKKFIFQLTKLEH